MENNNEAPENNPAVSSSSSVVQVDSIYIALSLALPEMEISCSCHKGFTIRGYAASKRGSNPDLSSIYPSSGGSDGRELPPMEVPSFRYWHCSCVKIEEEAIGVQDGIIADMDERIPPTRPNLGTPEQGRPADANQEIRDTANSEGIQQSPSALATESTRSVGVNVYANVDAVEISMLPSPTAPKFAAPTDVPTIFTGVTEVPAEELNAVSSDFQYQSDENTAKDASRKTDKPENDRSREVEHSNGVPKKKRKLRSLADILGAQDNSKTNPTERASCALVESVGSGKAASDGQQSPRRKRLVIQQEEVTNDKTSKRDKGKAIVTEVDDSDLVLVPSRGEGLFIGSKEERLRNRSGITPPPSRKKSKQTLVPDYSKKVSELIQSFPAPPAARSLESQEEDQNHAGLKLHPSHSRPAKLGLDLSLGSFPKRSHYQNNGGKGSQKKNDTQYVGLNPGTHLQLDRSSGKGSLDLNKTAAHITTIPLQGKMDFLQLGPKEKSSDQANQKESDQRGADDIPMDIVELLAKQQYERTNSDAGYSPIVHGSSDSPRRFRDVAVGETANHWMRGYSGLPNFHALGPQHGAPVPCGGSPLSLSQLKLAPLEDHLRSVSNLPQSQSQRTSRGLPISARAGPQYPTTVFPSALGFRFGGQENQEGKQHRGKTISDIKADELKKTEEAARFNFTKPGSSAGASKGSGAFDGYGNESIPALQLMSLMDGRSSGTGFTLGNTRTPNRPYSPCSAHPQFYRDERQGFLSGSLFTGQLHPKDSMPNPPSSYQSLRPHSPALSGHISFRTPEIDISRDLLQKTGSSSGIRPGSDLYFPHLHDPRIRGRSVGQRCVRPADSNRAVLETMSVPGVVRTGRTVSVDGVCRTNRNPAEFSFPEPGNMYTISSKDLSSRKKRRPYSRRTPDEKAADDPNRRQGNTIKENPADEHPSVGSS